jgi:glycosyltransferase involved in cell wall biosynthesis
VLLEALASGIPVVTARSAGGSELIEPEAGCVIEDSEDHVLLASMLEALARDGAGRARMMGRQARALAERYSWAVMARRYLDVLATAAAERRRESLA